MDFSKRNKDLVEVFNSKWKANHSIDIEKLKEKDKIRSNKLYSRNNLEYEKKEDFQTSNSNIVKSSREIQLERLERNMSTLKTWKGNKN
jgi:hypothetical protein